MCANEMSYHTVPAKTAATPLPQIDCAAPKREPLEIIRKSIRGWEHMSKSKKKTYLKSDSCFYNHRK